MNRFMKTYVMVSVKLERIDAVVATKRQGKREWYQVRRERRHVLVSAAAPHICQKNAWRLSPNLRHTHTPKTALHLFLNSEQ